MPITVLSFAILFVGSAAAASSVHKRCLMPSEQMQPIPMEASQNQDTMHTDCMKVETKAKNLYMIHPVCLSRSALCLLPRLRIPFYARISVRKGVPSYRAIGFLFSGSKPSCSFSFCSLETPRSI